MKELGGRSSLYPSLALFVIALLLLTIEGSLLGVIFTGANTPDLLLILVTCLAFLWGEKKGIVLGLFAGLLQDLFFGPALGFFALAKIVVAYLAGITAREIYKDQLAGPMLVVFMATFIHEFLIFFLRMIFWGSSGDFFYLLDVLFLPKAVYHLMLTIPFYSLLYHADQKGYFYPLSDN